MQGLYHIIVGRLDRLLHHLNLRALALPIAATTERLHLRRGRAWLRGDRHWGLLARHMVNLVLQLLLKIGHSVGDALVLSRRLLKDPLQLGHLSCVFAGLFNFADLGGQLLTLSPHICHLLLDFNPLLLDFSLYPLNHLIGYVGIVRLISFGVEGIDLLVDVCPECLRGLDFSGE